MDLIVPGIAFLIMLMAIMAFPALAAWFMLGRRPNRDR